MIRNYAVLVDGPRRGARLPISTFWPTTICSIVGNDGWHYRRSTDDTYRYVGPCAETEGHLPRECWHRWSAADGHHTCTLILPHDGQRHRDCTGHEIEGEK